MPFASVAVFFAIRSKVSTFGNIPGTMRQAQTFVSDLPTLVFTNPFPLDQTPGLKLFQ
jgi:hypothetical protein